MKEDFPSVLQKLRNRGSSGSMSRITIVPADPDKPIPGQNTVARYAVNDKKGKDENGSETEEQEQKEDDGDTRSYWIPRHSMICLLEDEIQEQEQRRKTLSEVRYQIQFGEVQIKKSTQFTDIAPKEDGTIQVTAQENDGKTETYMCNLVVAADGYNSSVRERGMSQHQSMVGEFFQFVN
jgi:2-polyprenyl-6-methoxyphenol hydroxylase-like FAD-dependent oxidoreductase